MRLSTRLQVVLLAPLLPPLHAVAMRSSAVATSCSTAAGGWMSGSAARWGCSSLRVRSRLAIFGSRSALQLSRALICAAAAQIVAGQQTSFDSLSVLPVNACSAPNACRACTHRHICTNAGWPRTLKRAAILERKLLRPAGGTSVALLGTASASGAASSEWLSPEAFSEAALSLQSAPASGAASSGRLPFAALSSVSEAAMRSACRVAARYMAGDTLDQE